MKIIEILLILLVVICGGIATKTDFIEGRIFNKVLLRLSLPMIFLDIIYYGYYVRDSLAFFLINTIFAYIFAIFLYAFHIWAAGDAKLIGVLLLGLPGRYLDFLPNGIAPIFIIYVIIFSIAFLYLCGDSLQRSINDGSFFHQKIHMKGNFSHFFLSYFFMIINISISNIALLILRRGALIQDSIAVMGIDFMLILIFLRFRDSIKQRTLMIITCLEWIIMFVLFGFSIIPFRFSWSYLRSWVFAIIVMYLRSLAEQYNYQVINTYDVKEGMIPAAVTILQFQSSRIKGLPTCMTEDLRARLSSDEVVAINRWGNSKNGKDHITIVSKLPFAIFIYIGVLIFLALEGAFYWHIV